MAYVATDIGTTLTTFDRDSRYKRDGKVYEIDGERFVGIRRQLPTPTSTRDLHYLVTAGDEGRLDIIANKMYANYKFWWIIADANGMDDPVRETRWGRTLRIPDLGVIFTKLL